jgi:UTP--glucose-1-phosphate uridylyltransferase
MTANVEFALRHPELGEQFKTFLKDLKL